ncbi:MAG: hypothetical protein Q7R33_10420, partial [Nitrosarchaeum sp.]|nr:hypothetical protein [Nitrosarchaeum sp.]
ALPKELQDIVEAEISLSGLPDQIFNTTIPVTIDEKELEKIIKQQSSNEFIGLSETIRKNAQKLKQIPSKLTELQEALILFDFCSGISKFIDQTFTFPASSDDFSLLNSENLLLEKAQPISFHLNQENKCSILTGANSGGKTTLIEHILQSISLFQLGLPTKGILKTPIFSEIYYFAKNKGSMSKGAFETLLTQMSKIQPGKKTLILADEIESVTEPGVAGKIICATAEYFIKQDCFLVIATHLGQEIQKYLPQYARIDGIEAKGLDENYELIVDHNPVLGRLANSTPELIVERLANSQDEDYFKYIHEYLKGM